MRQCRLQSQQGLATVEFSVIATMALLMAFIIVDFGALIQAQAVVTNVTREGGSLASRDLKTGSDLMTLMESGSVPLNFSDNTEKFKIFMVKVNAAVDGESDPTCSDSTQAEADGYYSETGALVDVPDHASYKGLHVTSPVDQVNCGLPQSLWDLLQFDDDPAVNGSAIAQFTMVRVYWVHQAMTPLEGILKLSGNQAMNFDYFASDGSVATSGNPDTHDFSLDSMLLSSTALF